LAAAILVAAAVIVVVSMTRGHSNTSSSNRPVSSPSEDSGGDSQGASSTGPEAGQPGRSRPTYARAEGGGIYFDLLPAEEGNPEDRDRPLGRLTSGATQDFGEVPVHAGSGLFRFRISSANGTPVNRYVRIGGPDAQDFSSLEPDPCEKEPCRPTGFHCSAAVCFCSRPVCQFGTHFEPSAVGLRRATLLIGDTPYVYLTGIGLPEWQEEQERSTSTSSTSVPTSGATSTSNSSGSTVQPPSTTATTHSPAAS